MSILFLASEPTETARVRVGREAREIEQRLRASRNPERFTFHHRSAVRPEDLTAALLELSPCVVHFSGHGTTGGELCFEDNAGESHPVSVDGLADMFGLFSSTVSCVILNACYSDRQAEAIARHVDHVIGMGTAVTDEASLAFSVGFYQALGAGRKVEDAFQIGGAMIGLSREAGDHLKPVLRKRQK